MKLSDFLTFKKITSKHVLIGMLAILGLLLMVNYLFHYGKKSRATGESVELSFNPASASAVAGQDFTTTIKAKPGVDITIRGYNFSVAFDKTKVKVKDLRYKLGTVSEQIGDDNTTLTAVNASGVIKVQGEIRTSAGQVMTALQLADVLAITFTSSSSSTSLVSVNTVGAAFSKINSDYSLSPVAVVSAGDLQVNGSTATGTPTLTPSPTVPLTGDPNQGITLNLKLKFQGILKEPKEEFNSFRVRVIAVSASGKKTEGGGTFTADKNGIWSGSARVPVIPGAGFKLFVKGPRHLQKRICSSEPTETFPGSYHCENGHITLTNGVNDLDFSGVYQLVGDLPQQDGTVNSYDISLVRNNIGSVEPSVLALADLNLDGIVDSQDYSLVIAALSIRSDEGE